MTEEKKKRDYKSIIMAALASVPENMLPNKAFLWAASNLPDSDEQGSFSKGNFNIEYNHEDDDVLKAVGLNKGHGYFISKYGELHYSLISKLSEYENKEDAVRDNPGITKISGEFQKFIEKVGNDGLLWLAVRGFMELRSDFSDEKGSLLSKIKASAISLDKDDVENPRALGKLLENLKSQLEGAMKDPDSVGGIVVNGVKIEKEEDLPESMPDAVKKLIMAIVITINERKK